MRRRGLQTFGPWNKNNRFGVLRDIACRPVYKMTELAIVMRYAAVRMNMREGERLDDQERGGEKIRQNLPHAWHYINKDSHLQRIIANRKEKTRDARACAGS